MCQDIVIMLWCLWRRQNDKVWEGDMKDVRLAVHLAREVLKQWQTVREKTVQQQQAMTDAEIHWQPPEEDCVKCNIDAAIFGEQRCFGFGMCVRNSQGHFIKVLTKWYEGTPPPYLKQRCWVYEMLFYGLVK